MILLRAACWLLLSFAAFAADANDESMLLESRLVHLRSGPVREWSEFPATADGSEFDRKFPAKTNDREFSLKLRQQDVKQGWRITLNGQALGELTRDENDMVLYLAIPAGRLVDGENALRIEPSSRRDQTSDDIRVGQARIEPRPVREVLSKGTVEVTVTDSDQGRLLPCRLTIVDADGALQSVGAHSNEQIAVRPGTIYTASGQAKFGVPAGRYTIFAGRGFEYSLAQTQVVVAAGETAQTQLSIRREVPTEGYVSCDTHIHTLTHSGHGDSSITERLITLAGEGIELPIATDHNIHVDYEPLARELHLRQQFTPVMGNEVTTSVGHFNVFPILPGARVPDHKSKDWSTIFEEIFQTPGVRVVILNHARDLHSGVRPFGPKLHNAVVGENLNGWPMRFNAMEVVNSGAVQSDVQRLFRDWMSLLNRGYSVTPVGSSDSHDVARHFVGQGRTYIRCDDRDPGQLDVGTAVTNFLQGHVMVSYGLLTELTVDDKYHSGDLVPPPADQSSKQHLAVHVRILGPHWTKANRVLLYSNGTLIREERLPNVREKTLATGVLWEGRWELPRPRHDVHLVAIALGPGIDGAFWRTAKPYQPASPDWDSQVIGCSGAVWIDGDRNGRRDSAYDYAKKTRSRATDDLPKLVAALASYDEAVAAQAAHLLRLSGVSLQSEVLQTELKAAPASVQVGFRAYAESWRENEIARSER